MKLGNSENVLHVVNLVTADHVTLTPLIVSGVERDQELATQSVSLDVLGKKNAHVTFMTVVPNVPMMSDVNGAVSHKLVLQSTETALSLNQLSTTPLDALVPLIMIVQTVSKLMDVTGVTQEDVLKTVDLMLIPPTTAQFIALKLLTLVDNVLPCQDVHGAQPLNHVSTQPPALANTVTNVQYVALLLSVILAKVWDLNAFGVKIQSLANLSTPTV